jgi:hypothetical protein
MTDSFWAGGRDAYAKALRDQYGLRLTNLHNHRNRPGRCERCALDAEIEKLESEFKSKLDSIDDSLF